MPPHPLLDKRTHRPEYINITDHPNQLSSIGCQHGRRTNFLLSDWSRKNSIYCYSHGIRLANAL